MKNYIYTLFFIFITICLLGACTKEITGNIKDLSGNPVLNTILRPDTFVSVQLTRSRPVLGEGANSPYLPISDANIKLYENGVEKMISYDSLQERYVSNWKPELGKKYAIEANIPSQENPIKAAAEEILAPISLSYFDTDSVNINNTPYLYVKYTIDDTPGADYYHVLIRFRCLTNGIVTYETPIYVDYSLSDPTESTNGGNANASFMEVYPYGGFLFSDKNRDGSSISFNLPVNLNNMQCDASAQKQLYVEVRKCSEAYFYYMSTVSDFTQNSGNPFGTPVQVYSNIQNGRGIWATYSKTTFTYDL